VPDGRIWYRVSGTGSGTPVVRYDQLGGGKSDGISDTTLFTIPHFVRELDSLRSYLGHSKVHLVGHSWGTILAVEYYRAHPEQVASLTLASAALDIPAWERSARRLVGTLPDSSQRAIRLAEQQGKFDGPAYQAALGVFYGKYVWRRPVEADLDSTMSTVNEAIYNHMQGPSEFTITGTLKSYDATPLLQGIEVPTLYTVGQFDEADPPTIERFARMTPRAQVVVIPGAAHITTWDAPEAMVEAVRKFLRTADSGAHRP